MKKFLGNQDSKPQIQNDQRLKADFSGGANAFVAFLLWGLFPIYWKALKHIPSLELLCHRIVWSSFFLFILYKIQSPKGGGLLRDGLINGKGIFFIFLSSLTIGTNWYLYIWAVLKNHVIETSLGYFINPLLNIVLGFIFFKERLRPLQWISVSIAALGVLNQALNYGKFPWIALSLALTFGFYGLMRKISKLNSLVAIFLETLILGLPSLAYLLYTYLSPSTQGWEYGNGTTRMITFYLLLGSGVVTSIPLICFGNAAKKLQLSTLGLFQFLAPTCQFLIAIFLYAEPFTSVHKVTFACIWSALFLFSIEGIYQNHRRRIPAKT